jgi:hypothetical protein
MLSHRSVYGYLSYSTRKCYSVGSHLWCAWTVNRLMSCRFIYDTSVLHVCLVFVSSVHKCHVAEFVRVYLVSLRDCNCAVLL